MTYMAAKPGDIMVVNDCLLWKGVATSGRDITILYPVDLAVMLSNTLVENTGCSLAHCYGTRTNTFLAPFQVVQQMVTY